MKDEGLPAGRQGEGLRLEGEEIISCTGQPQTKEKVR